MKRVKTVKRAGVRQSLLLAGLVMVSATAHASPAMSGAGGAVQSMGMDLDPAYTTYTTTFTWLYTEPLQAPAAVYPVFLPAATSLNMPVASTSVSGNMNYTIGSGSGYFSESDSSQDGSKVVIELSRKGYGYQAEAASQTGLAHVLVKTKWNSSSSGFNYGTSSAYASAYATSTWSDWFVISGGTGLGTATFSSILDGDLVSTKNGSAGYSLNIGYATGSYCGWWYNTCNEADQNQSLFSQTSNLTGKGKSTLQQEIEGDFTFEYDKPFQLTAQLNVNATNGGMAEFSLISLGNSLMLPTGAQLQNASGMYVQAVPEAETYAMMLSGLALVGFMAARRRSPRQ